MEKEIQYMYIKVKKVRLYQKKKGKEEEEGGKKRRKGKKNHFVLERVPSAAIIGTFLDNSGT